MLSGIPTSGITQEIIVAAISSCWKIYFVILLLWSCSNDATLHSPITRRATKKLLHLNSYSHSCVHLQLTTTKRDLGSCSNIDQETIYFYIQFNITQRLYLTGLLIGIYFKFSKILSHLLPAPSPNRYQWVNKNVQFPVFTWLTVHMEIQFFVSEKLTKISA